MAHIEQVLSLMVSQSGDPYIFGARASRSNADPDAFDCSELVEWACNRAGVAPRMPDGSKNQKAHCEQKGTLVPVDEAIETRGALVFRMTGSPTHVVASLGNGETIEARGSAYGVGEFRVRERGWTHGALVPGADYDPPAPEVPPIFLASSAGCWCPAARPVPTDASRRGRCSPTEPSTASATPRSTARCPRGRGARHPG